MKYNPIQALMSYYQKTAGFLSSCLRQGELEDKMNDSAKALRRAKLREQLAETRELLDYAARARCARYDRSYRNR